MSAVVSATLLGRATSTEAVGADAVTGPGQCRAGTPLSGYQDCCGHGPRLRWLVISPYAEADFVDHTATDQSQSCGSHQGHWLGATRIANGPFDAIANPITGMFDFGHRPKAKPLFRVPRRVSRSTR